MGVGQMLTKDDEGGGGDGGGIQEPVTLANTICEQPL